MLYHRQLGSLLTVPIRDVASEKLAKDCVQYPTFSVDPGQRMPLHSVFQAKLLDGSAHVFKHTCLFELLHWRMKLSNNNKRVFGSIMMFQCSSKEKVKVTAFGKIVKVLFLHFFDCFLFIPA